MWNIPWIAFGGTAAFVLALVGVGSALLFRLLKRLSVSRPQYRLLAALQNPGECAIFLVTLLMLLPASPLSPGTRETIERLLDLGLIASVAWMLIDFIGGFEETLALKYRVDTADNLLARRIRTRMEVFHNVSVAAIVLLSLAVSLMVFPNVRSLGASMLASAGLAGLIVGMAARPMLGNLIAGIQIAFTEPMRIEDVVIVEGEYGWIEEIYATYVVVRTWDLRRVILPLTYFIEHPFQNWTRQSTELLGSVFIYTDYSVPVEALRRELERILKASPLWRGRVAGLQVTDTTERAVQLRALMDASDSGKAWDLRCEVREKLLLFLQTHYPTSLPHSRISLTSRTHEPAVADFKPLG